MEEHNWYKKSYRRNLVDMHIEDWNPEFLSKFSPEMYVEMMKIAKVQSAMVYANSHVGYCYWPTKTGHMHRGIRGRDVFGEIGALCRKEGLDFIAYYSLIFNNWAYENNPEWRLVDVEGKSSREKKTGTLITGRYGLCCPNTGYREFVKVQIGELCGSYEFDGIFFDMTFWSGICYCPACKKRYESETGKNIPEVVDWIDPLWLQFQRKREEWMGEFASFATKLVKDAKPKVPVVHNSSPPTTLSWFFGAEYGVLDACDYLGADFYGDSMQQSFICKFFYNITKKMPFEYYTSRCDPNLNDDHVSMKSRETLMLHNYMTLAHGGAFLFIDAVDPDGSLNPEVYRIMGEIFGESEQIEPYLGGRLLCDAALYYSLGSKMDRDESCGSPAMVNMKMPHMDALLGATEILKENHIPFTVIGRSNLSDLASYRVLILPDTAVLTKEETEAFRNYVENGGHIYASGCKVLDHLSDVFGIEMKDEIKERVTFIAPTEIGKRLMPGLDEKYPLTIPTHQAVVEAKSDSEVLATVTLPYSNPDEFGIFASIHSNPPGIATNHPAIVYGSFGKGKTIWTAAPIEAVRRVPHKKVFKSLIMELAENTFTFEADAPSQVEVLVSHQKEKKRFVIHLMNELEGSLLLYIRDTAVRIRIGSLRPVRAYLPTGTEELEIFTNGAFAEIKIPSFQLYGMVILEYETQL